MILRIQEMEILIKSGIEISLFIDYKIGLNSHKIQIYYSVSLLHYYLDEMIRTIN